METTLVPVVADAEVVTTNGLLMKLKPASAQVTGVLSMTRF
jgi:hypothetical protein